MSDDNEIRIELIPPVEPPRADEQHWWGLIRRRVMTRAELEKEYPSSKPVDGVLELTKDGVTERVKIVNGRIAYSKTSTK